MTERGAFSRSWCRLLLAALTLFCAAATSARGEPKTFDGKYSIAQIDVRVVYFVPRDRTPLPDWRARVDYYCRRITAFHDREFQGQSRLKTDVHPEPFCSGRTTAQLQSGDADFIFTQTLNEVDAALRVTEQKGDAFPILLVLSDINWQPLEDFYRLKPGRGGPQFEGIISDDEHFPGSPLGGARATYLADRGAGLGLVSADGWRVPYRGSDCVVYHEGVGHAIGLPHTEPADGSVMSMAQYRGWLNESWLDTGQKTRLGWTPPKDPSSPKADLFSAFTARPSPRVPRPDQDTELVLHWPEQARVRRCRVRYQTDLFGPWTELAPIAGPETPARVRLARFDRPTPVSYRVDAELEDGQRVELWGYLQVRERPDQPPRPAILPEELTVVPAAPAPSGPDVDLLALVDVKRDAVLGEWTRNAGSRLVAPKRYGARIEIPYTPPDEYQLTVVVEPLDEPGGLILGQRLGGSRFLTLIHYPSPDGPPASALENVDGDNVETNPTAIRRAVLRKGHASEIVCTVRRNHVDVTVDREPLLDWRGDASRLSLSDYWKTPHAEALFLGAYDCRVRFDRVTLTPLRGEGRRLSAEAGP